MDQTVGVQYPCQWANSGIVMAASQQAHFVSGDWHLLQLADDLPIHRPAEFLRRLDADQR